MNIKAIAKIAAPMIIKTAVITVVMVAAVKTVEYAIEKSNQEN